MRQNCIIAISEPTSDFAVYIEVNHTNGYPNMNAERFSVYFNNIGFKRVKDACEFLIRTNSDSLISIACLNDVLLSTSHFRKLIRFSYPHPSAMTVCALLLQSNDSRGIRRKHNDRYNGVLAVSRFLAPKYIIKINTVMPFCCHNDQRSSMALESLHNRNEGSFLSTC